MIKVIATDFDGVICDGLAEYFYSSKLAYERIWPGLMTEVDQIQAQFNYLRPVIETGWEMPVLLRALKKGHQPSEIMREWRIICQTILDEENLDLIKISQTLDMVRKEQIKNNLSAWLGLHRFYDGVIRQINNFLNEQIKLYIITTKESLFVQELLKEHNLNLDQKFIIGKEKKRPKYETLRLIIAEEKVESNQVCFLEDRLEALKLVKQQSDLKNVKLFLADWGYNTEKTRASLLPTVGIKLLSLTEFTSDNPFFHER